MTLHNQFSLERQLNLVWYFYNQCRDDKERRNQEPKIDRLSKEYLDLTGKEYTPRPELYDSFQDRRTR